MYTQKREFFDKSSKPPDMINEDNRVWIFVDCFLFIVIVLGNVLTIVAIAVTRQLRSIVSNYFVLNLAVSDLLVGVSLLYYVAFYFNDEFSHDKSICISRFVLLSVACGASITNIMVIAVDRYLAIVHPLSYNAYATTKCMLLIVVVTWLCTIAVASIPIYWNIFNASSTCEFETVLPRDYIVAIQMPSFLLTWVVMFLLYVKIWKEARMCARRINLSIVSDLMEKNNHRSVQVVLMIVGCFTICWLPCFFVASIRSFGWLGEWTSILYKITFTLSLANSAMNPLIYAWKNASFRRAFQKILRFKSPNNKFNSSLKVFLEQQRNENRSKQNDTESDHRASENSPGLCGYPSEQRPSNHGQEGAREENTTL